MFKLVILLLFFTLVENLPLMRMRLCISSTDPSRLQSQCVLCHNRRFKVIIRQCTGGSYLPANVSVDEGVCLLRSCRSQMPLVAPQPLITSSSLPGQFTQSPSTSGNNEMHTEALYTGSGEAAQHQAQFPYVNPAQIRPPATIYYGNPFRPG